ncbi:MAG: hypothetical protein U0136_16565 [Bdellovibrionota bacterium]
MIRTILNSKKTYIFLGGALLGAGLAEPAHAFDTGVIDWAIGELCGHIQGSLGSLLTTVAAFGAIVAAAMGSYRVFYGAIMTAVGAFAVSTIMSLYFPDAANICSSGSTTGRTAPTSQTTARTTSSAASKAAGEQAAADVSTDPFDSLSEKF